MLLSYFPETLYCASTGEAVGRVNHVQLENLSFSESTPEADDAASLPYRLTESRRLSVSLTASLSDEDMVVQAFDDASPAKWHLAHTTWFYEAFVLQPFLDGYQEFSDDFSYCFNSYYESIGDRHPRADRGLLTRPSTKEVLAYRTHVDAHLERLLDNHDHTASDFASLAQVVEVGINHEQQHQELLLTDILALFARQPLKPSYLNTTKIEPDDCEPEAVSWVPFRGGVAEVGHAGSTFSYDNEGPRHHVLLHPFKLANRCVTNSEWIEFIEDGGYSDSLIWLADGWDCVQRNQWQAPEYWQWKDGVWQQMTLAGLQPVDHAAPVSHVSYYEADAFARWAGKRLPTEFEWEMACLAQGEVTSANTLGENLLKPAPAKKPDGDKLTQMIGDVWEWTSSAYQPYPGYQAPEGALGEYNGKFMCSQYVLRGGSCVTPDGHVRPTYRNFFYPYQRWQFMGLRLADNA